MDVSPQTIRQVEFREKLRGYHQDDVDEFLERVAAAFEIMQERLRLANDRAVRAEAAAGSTREDDEALRRTLVLAQRTADLAVQEGRDQAARMLESAETEAAAMRAEAEEESRRLLEDSQAQVRADVARLEATKRQLDEDVERLSRYLDEHRERAKAVLAEASANLDAALQLPPRPAPAPPPPSGYAAAEYGRTEYPGQRGDYAPEPVPYASAAGAEMPAAPAYDDRDDDHAGEQYDRDLLAEVIDRSDESDSSGFWRRRS
ncbi:MAG TPA: DivIVA domain-containing protein [Acidimicrobiales bacterium]|nr:DivIVA domain-containing protein [Acidimicrobiales bacterium]